MYARNDNNNNNNCNEKYPLPFQIYQELIYTIYKE